MTKKKFIWTKLSGKGKSIESKNKEVCVLSINKEEHKKLSYNKDTVSTFQGTYYRLKNNT